MAKTHFQNVAQFDTNSGVTETPGTFKTNPPGLTLTSGAYCYKDTAGAFDNNGFTTWVSFSDITNGKFRLAMGCDALGAGKAIDIVLTSSNWKVQYNNITTWTGAAAATNVEKELQVRSFEIANNVFYPLKVYLANNLIAVYFNNIFCFQANNFTPTAGYWGLSGIDTGTTVYTSDLYAYENQTFWGNVNIDGVPHGELGRAIMFDQPFAEVIEVTKTDSNGDYMIFVDADPAAGNVYFLIGYIENRLDIQPRGIGNITL